VVIKKQNTNEYDQFVTFYTEEFGKLTAIAKSILKPSSIQAMHLDTLNLVEFELINGRAMPIVAGAQAANCHRELKNSIPALAVASFFTEVVDKMVLEMEKDERLWSFLVDTLDKLNRVGDLNLVAFLRQKQFYLLGLLGYSPQVAQTASADTLYRPGRSAIDDAFEYNSGFRLKSLNFMHSVLSLYLERSWPRQIQGKSEHSTEA